MEGALLVCRNCKRRVASNHLGLHEAHCLMYLVLCPECKEPVLQHKMEEHRQGGHQQVGCAMCQQSVPKHLLESHEAQECQERPVECQFCQLAVRLNKVDLHEHHCGQQTELCPDCGQHVMLRVLARHREECRREQLQLQKGKSIPAPESNICCHYCNQMIPGNKYFPHLDRCRRVSGAVTPSPVGKPEIPPSSPSSWAAEDQTSKAEKDVRPKLSQALLGWLSQVCLRPSLGPGGSDGNESACRAGDGGSILGLGRCPGGGHGNPLQYSCLENPMDRGAWRATVHSPKDSEATERRTLRLGWQWLWLPRERPRQWTGTRAGSGQERWRTIGPAQPKSWAEPLPRVQRGRAGGRGCGAQPPASRP